VKLKKNKYGTKPKLCKYKCSIGEWGIAMLGWHGKEEGN
jgi:hypothetical protein